MAGAADMICRPASSMCRRFFRTTMRNRSCRSERRWWSISRLEPVFENLRRTCKVRTRRERPCSRATEQRDELTAVHSMTSLMSVGQSAPLFVANLGRRGRIRRQDCAIGDGDKATREPTPMASRCFACVAVKRAVLDRRRRNDNPFAANQHLHSIRSQTVLCWAAIMLVTTTSSGAVLEQRVDVVGVEGRWPIQCEYNKQQNSGGQRARDCHRPGTRDKPAPSHVVQPTHQKPPFTAEQRAGERLKPCFAPVTRAIKKTSD